MFQPRHLVILLVCAAVGLGMGKKKNVGTVASFHIEAGSEDSEKFVFDYTIPNTGITLQFKKYPEFTNREMLWYYPFEAKSGGGYGAVFQLKPAGSRRLEAVSSQNPGKLLLANIAAGTASSLIRIDRSVSDGVVVVWQGLTQEHLDLLDEAVMRLEDTQANDQRIADDAAKEPNKVQQFGPDITLPSTGAAPLPPTPSPPGAVLDSGLPGGGLPLPEPYEAPEKKKKKSALSLPFFN